MEAATMEQVQAEEGLVEKEAAVTLIAELVKAMEGYESQQGGEETERIVYFEGNEKGAIESNDSIAEAKPGNEKSDSNITRAGNQKSLVTVYDRKRDGNPKDDSLNEMHLLPSEKLQSGGSLSLKDRRQEVIELDVERVIEEQDTHDLYCPNCNSCITKRVILRKRKRKIRSIHYDAKVNLNGSSSGPATNESDTMVNSNGSSSAPATNWIGQVVNLNGSSSAPATNGIGQLVNLNGSSSAPATNKIGTVINLNGSGNSSAPATNNIGIVVNLNGSGSSSVPATSKIGTIVNLNGRGSSSIPATSEIDTVDNLNGSSSAPATNTVPDNSVPPVNVKEPLIFRCLSCFTFFIPTAHGFEPVRTFEETGEGENIQSPEQIPARNVNWFFSCFESTRGEKTAENAHGFEPVQTFEETGEGENIQSPEQIPARNVNWFFSCFESTRGEKTDENGDDVAVYIPTGQDVHVVNLAVPGRTHEWDILKSIIYGGLIETITSLGVVSSAAASDASTLNIIVLGLANLMSGLIIIIHNITELKNDFHEETSEANSNIDRYQETLGRRENFRLHAIFAVMSFLVFGLLPPVTYGFSFHGTDDKLYKLITCVAASLVCIILLSIGKAHVQKPPKPYIKTILKYLFIGLLASGLCYAVGLLINRFLENSGWFDTTLAPSTVFLETRSMKSGSAFYE